MKSYQLAQIGITNENIPILKFETELHEGVDLDGKFKIQFAAIKKDNEPHFAINSPKGILAVFDLKDSKKISSALEEAGEYIVCANYDNKSWEEHSGYTTLLMGRDLGSDVDYRERYQLKGEEYKAIKEISKLINS